MKHKNIHGSWTVRFENRVLYTKFVGLTNLEASVKYNEEMQSLILSSSEADRTPWVGLTDCREWEGAPQDSGEEADQVLDWAYQHNCIFVAIVFDKKIQQFIAESNSNSKAFSPYFDYDEARQACLSKLAKAKKNHDK